MKRNSSQAAYRFTGLDSHDSSNMFQFEVHAALIVPDVIH